MTEFDKHKTAAPQDGQDPAISSLYRQTPQETPSPALDDNILRAARSAVSPAVEAVTPKRTPLRQWSLLGGLAAGVIVAVLAVKLLPYQFQSAAPKPVLHERAEDRATQVGSAEQKSMQAPAGLASETMPPDSSAAQPQPMQKQSERSAMDLQSQKAEPEQATDTLKRNAAITPSLTPAAPAGAMNAASVTARDGEFDSIVALWNSGQIDAAVARFDAFMQQYPDYTPQDSHLDLFEALQAELYARNQPQPTPAPAE